MDLAELRARLGQIDTELVDLIAERQNLAEQVLKVKLESGTSTRNYKQERVVVERARSRAREKRVDEDLAERIVLELIRGSLTLQEQKRVEASQSGTGKQALVIGGSGKMGRWFCRFLSSQGYGIEIADPNAGSAAGEFPILKDLADSKLDHDLIVVSAPLAASGDILEELATRKPPGLIFDVGSLKSPLRAGLKRLADTGCKVTSIHPMFGPSTELLSGRHVIFVDVGSAEANQEAKDLFASTMAVQVEMDLESHDRLIAYVLGLSHALNIAFFTALAESGEAAPKLATLSSTTFDAQLEVAMGVSEENPNLYFEIQKLNDYGTESLSALSYAVERLCSIVRANDLEGFRALMQKGQTYLAGRRQDSTAEK